MKFSTTAMKPLALLLFSSVAFSACGSASNPEPTASAKPAATAPAKTPEPTATAEPTKTPTPKPTVSALVKEARGFAKGTSYAAPMRLVTNAEPNGDGVDVQTKLYEDAEGKAIAKKIAAPFMGMGYMPVRVYADNGILLLKTP